MTPKELVAANIRVIRKRQRLTQGEAATRIGWTQQTWGDYERGDISPGVEVLAQITRALETSMAELVSLNIETSAEASAKKVSARRRKAA